jgi:hypothetical protein
MIVDRDSLSARSKRVSVQCGLRGLDRCGHERDRIMSTFSSSPHSILFLREVKHVAETADRDENRDSIKTVKRATWSGKSEIFQGEAQAGVRVLVSLTIFIANLHDLACYSSEGPFVVEVGSPDRQCGSLLWSIVKIKSNHRPYGCTCAPNVFVGKFR